jgi:glutamine amidotransferase
MKILVADYGVGNLHSISKALEKAGAEVEIASDVNMLVDAECVVFPGVGAFGAAMGRLNPILPALRSRIMSGMPALGVCLGMQVMFEKSEESSGDGVGVFKGEVKRLNAVRVPQMGWNDVSWEDDPMFDGVPRGSQFYYANSYICRPVESVSIAETEYGEMFPAAVRRGGLCGVQFHPEKSGPPGLRLLSNFVKIAEDSR